MTHIQYIAAVAFFHFLVSVQLAPSISAGISLKIIPLFSPDSPLYPGNLSHSERIQKMLEVEYLRSTLSHNDAMDPQNIIMPVHGIKDFMYFVEISLGSPKHSQYLALDIGSDLIWTQCQPCIDCYQQKAPIFDSRASTSYKKLPSNDPRSQRQGFRCQNGECRYAITYGDDSKTKGIASTETFTFSNSKGQELTLSNIVFGCSNDNKKMRLANTKISGVLGLNMGSVSLGTQLKGRINEPSRFTYCLVPFQREMEATSLLKFGEGVGFGTRQHQTTPFVDGENNYYLNLVDISVGNQRIGFQPGTFARRNKKGGCFLDSGTMGTFMDKVPYQDVMKRFDELYMSVGRRKVKPKSTTFEYCYNFDENFKEYVPMTYHFQGADLKIEGKQLCTRIEEAFCVIISPVDYFTVIGAVHQQNTRFVFDLDKRQIEFAPEECGRNNM